MDFIQAVESKPERIVLRFGVDRRSSKQVKEQDYVQYWPQGSAFTGVLVDAYGKEWADGAIQPAVVVHDEANNVVATVFCADSLAQAIRKCFGDDLRKNKTGRMKAAGSHISITLVEDEQFEGWSRRTWQVATK